MDTHADVFAAVDFGAGSGRVIAGFCTGDKVELKEIYRFRNGPVERNGFLCWDAGRLFDEMVEGLRRLAMGGIRPHSIGIDTWGVDFVLLDAKDNIVGDTVCYRDPRTEGMPEKFFTGMGRSEYYSAAGIQIMPINTIFQLMSVPEEDLARAESLLFMPDYFTWRLTGRKANELTIASTSGLLDARTGNWSDRIIAAAGLPRRIFQDIAAPGTVCGTLLPEWAEATGLGPVRVIAVGSHDTASAVNVPSVAEPGTAFLSSGTWSLLGTVLGSPVLSQEAMQAGFTNERGSDGKVTFLQNITGMWIMQQLSALWRARGEDVSHERLNALAEAASTDAVIDVDAADFTAPEDMEEAIRNFCARRGDVPPEGIGEITLCVLRSLAIRYARGIRDLEKITGTAVRRLNVVGGGSRNTLLNRLTASLAGVEVVPGPVEATAMGNIMLQASVFKASSNN